MLTTLEADILRRLITSGEIIVTHLAQSDMAPYWSLEEKHLVELLSRYSSGSERPEDYVVITPLGRDALDEHGQALKEHAQEKAYKAAEKRDRQASELRAERQHAGDVRRSWFHFFGGVLVGWILGGFTLAEFCQWIGSLFH